MVSCTLVEPLHFDEWLHLVVLEYFRYHTDPNTDEQKRRGFLLKCTVQCLSFFRRSEKTRLGA